MHGGLWSSKCQTQCHVCVPHSVEGACNARTRKHPQGQSRRWTGDGRLLLLREIHNDSCILERVDKHDWRGKGPTGKDNRSRHPFAGAKTGGMLRDSPTLERMAPSSAAQRCIAWVCNVQPELWTRTR